MTCETSVNEPIRTSHINITNVTDILWIIAQNDHNEVTLTVIDPAAADHVLLISLSFVLMKPAAWSHDQKPVSSILFPASAL